MASPKRWLEDGAPPEVRRLLRAARVEQPNRRAVERAVLVVGSATAAVTTTTGVLGAAAKVGSTSLGWAAAKWGAAAILGLGVATTTVATVRHYQLTGAATRPTAQLAGARGETATKPSPHVRGSADVTAISERGEAQASVATPTVSETGSVAIVTQAPPAVEVSSALPISSPSSNLSAGIAASNRVRSTSSTAAANNQRNVANTNAEPTLEGNVRVGDMLRMPQSDPQLMEEMRHLDGARTALRDGNPGEALRRLDEYGQRCAGRRMLPEAMLLRMRAELRLGRGTAAAHVAREILAQFPGSPHAAQAEQLLGKLEAND